MRKFAVPLAVLLSLLAVPIRSRAQEKFEVFGGYSYTRVSVPFVQTILCPLPVCPIATVNNNANLNGWELSGAYKPTPWLGLAGDFCNHYGSALNANVRLHTYLFGPQVSYPGRVSPFAHALFGGAHESNDAGGTGGFVVVPATRNSFAAAVGVGIDIKLIPFVSVRPIQIDYLLTRFNSSSQSQPRVSAGVLFHF